MRLPPNGRSFGSAPSIYADLWPHPNTNPKTRMSNIEQGLPAFGGARGDQGISNDEVKPCLLFPSVFDIRYSIFCGSLLTFYRACRDVTG
jgi:hypothetical protein